MFFKKFAKVINKLFFIIENVVIIKVKFSSIYCGYFET